jgi:probable LLM family oxidoreductase
MEIGIDSFAINPSSNDQIDPQRNVDSMNELIHRIEFADEMGLDVFGIGEHHRKEFLDSANTMILAAAAARTKKIKLTSAVTVLSASDPVRVFQNFATLDLISGGRAEIVAGRGSFTDAFPLFGYNLADYDALFIEKLNLLLKIRASENVTWTGKFRQPLYDQPIYPRPYQDKLPIWLGVGGTPSSFIRAGEMGLPLMLAVIGGETYRFRPLVDSYREAGLKAGHTKEELKVGLHSLGFVGETRDEAMNSYYPGYAKMMNNVGKERGWAPMNRRRFEAQTGDLGAIVIGSPEEVAHKIVRHSKALGGISRFSFQMDASLTHDQLVQAIKLIGHKVKPLVNQLVKE